MTVVKAVLRRTADGLVKEILDDSWGEDGDEAGLFGWTKGNFSCDCNRSIFFGDGEDEDSDKCGDTRYRLVSISVEDVA